MPVFLKMRMWWVGSLFVALSSSSVMSEPIDDLHLASFNIHYIVPKDPKDDWDQRKLAVRAVIADMNADVIGFQEMETFTGGHFNGSNVQLDWVLDHFPKYQAGAIGNPAEFPITQPIIFDKDKYQLQEQGFLFFSETPTVIYSRQWDGRYPYFATWVLLNIRGTEQEFIVVNMHNDYKSRSNRLSSTQVVIDHLGKFLQSTPAFVVGDFNAPYKFKEVANFNEVGLTPVKPSGSTNRILGMRLLPAIDHILHSTHWTPKTGIVRWMKKYEGEYPSDHFPISVLFEWTDG